MNDGSLIIFSRQIKDHLADYKKTRLGILEDGVWKRNQKAYSHILPESLHRLNILETYRKEFWEYHGSHPEIKLHQDFHHLNSSQALCFNLFFPVLTERSAQEGLLEILDLSNERVTRCAFEEVLDPQEGTNFDFVMELESGRKVFFEVKYSEIEFGTVAADTSHLEKLRDIYLPRLKGRVKDGCLQPEIFFKNYQILRNLSYLNASERNTVIFLVPKGNLELKDGAEFISQVCQASFKKTVRVLYLEQTVDEIIKSPSLDSKTSAHYHMFREKYFSLVHQISPVTEKNTSVIANRGEDALATLVSSIEKLARENIGGQNHWYTWDINDSKFPDSVRIPPGSPYERNVALKHALHNIWIAGSKERKSEVIRWYIRVWGGIKGNNEETLRQYSDSKPDDLFALGCKGVASWSKALCIYDPDKYPIFDARVSAALNAILVLGQQTNITLFPCLMSQNRKVTQANGIFRDLSRKRERYFIEENECYRTYLELLKNVMARLEGYHEIGIYTLEMLLFSLAEELLNEAFPGELSVPKS